MGKLPQNLGQPQTSPAVDFCRKVIQWWLPLLYLLVSCSFYLRTYDSAQVKITLVHMGGITLIAAWMALLLNEGRNAFRRQDFVFFAPFLLYFAYIIFSFINVPYKGQSLDDFIRYLVYTAVAMVIINEFDQPAIARLTRIIIISTWIVIGYGTLQVIDTQFFFSKGLPGVDPFVWRGAFGTRVFSTYGNPNFYADYLLLTFYIVLAQFLKTRSFHLLLLMVFNLLNIFMTETKGAWVGLGASAAIFAVIYSVYFFSGYIEKYKRQILAAGAAVAILCFSVVGFYAYKRMQSVSFRVFTWLASWEIVQTQPLIGTGVGCFKVTYPAYRRPQIFHIEGKHNTETDHAEEEHLEQWMDNGIIGGGFYIWLIVFTIVLGLRAIKAYNAPLAKTGGRAPPVSYDLLGYMMAFIAMLLHNFFDVSMRFVSSGVYLGLLSGMVVNLSRGCALYEVHSMERGDNAAEGETPAPPYLWVLRFAAWGAIIWLAISIITDFNVINAKMPYAAAGETIQWFVSWCVLACLVLGLGYAFIRIVQFSRSSLAVLTILAVIYPLHILWGNFKADVNHNQAIYLSKQNDWDNAIKRYQTVLELNPNFVMAYYFRGNVFKDRLFRGSEELISSYNPDWGDKDNKPRTDFDRAMEAYEDTRRLAPNYVQMHYQVGELYMKMAGYYMRKGDRDRFGEYLDKAMARFNLYHNLDPVWPYTYYSRSQIYLLKGDYAAAVKELQENIAAPYCHQAGHKHETGDAYFRLGVIYAQGQRLKESLAAFEKAYELEPGNQNTVANITSLRAAIKAGRPVMQAPAPR